MSRKEQMKHMEEILAQYRARIEEKERDLAALRSELAGSVRMYNAFKKQPSDVPGSVIPPLRPPRSNVKQTLFELLQAAGETGLNAAAAVELAAKRNETLHQPTVSSLLSRFKADGVAIYDGSVYRLKEFAPANPEGNPMH